MGVLYLVLIFAGIYFVCVELERACADTSRRLRIPESIAGATLLAIASSAPEFFTSFLGAVIHNVFEVGLVAIIWSAIFNVTVIPGASALMASKPLSVVPTVIQRDCVAYAAITLLLLALIEDGVINRIDAMILLGAYGLYVYTLFLMVGSERGAEAAKTSGADFASVGAGSGESAAAGAPESTSTGEVSAAEAASEQPAGLAQGGQERADAPEAVDDDPPMGEEHGQPLWRTTAGLLGGIAAIGLLCHFMIVVGEDLSTGWGINFLIVSALVFAPGTSFPDLLLSVISARKGAGSASISNAFGSNSFDLTVCLAAPVLVIGEVKVATEGAVLWSIWMLLGTVALTMILVRTGYELTRREGGFLVASFVALATTLVIMIVRQ